MVKVKPGYQNVTEVKGALKSRGDSVKGKFRFYSVKGDQQLRVFQLRKFLVEKIFG